MAHTCIFCSLGYLVICFLNLKYIYIYIYIHIYKTPHTIPNQSGVNLGLIDENKLLYSFCLIT